MSTDKKEVSILEIAQSMERIPHIIKRFEDMVDKENESQKQLLKDLKGIMDDYLNEIKEENHD